MTAFHYTLTIELDFMTWDKPVNPELSEMLNHVLQDWSDGRYPFDVEMLYEGISRAIKKAAQHVVQKEMDDKYGDEMVVSEDGNSRMSRAYLEAAKAPLDVPYINGEARAKIERKHPPDERFNKILNMTDTELAS